MKEQSKNHVDPLLMIDNKLQPTEALRSMFNGVGFLVGGGPSFNSDIAAQLNRRGVWSMAINNVAGVSGFRPSAFVCSDPPSKFHHGIWLDPTVMKFIPAPKFGSRRDRNHLREIQPDGGFTTLQKNGEDVRTPDVPNIWGFKRRAWLTPDDTFFTEDSAAWGNHKKGWQQTGEPRTVNTLLLGTRLMYYLGFRRVYLLGVDFFMDPQVGELERYAFEEVRDDNAVASNNNQFAVTNRWLCTMQKDGVFNRYGLELFNCAPRSGLRAFGHIPFDRALADALEGYPEEPFNLKGWYKK